MIPISKKFAGKEKFEPYCSNLGMPDGYFFAYDLPRNQFGSSNPARSWLGKLNTSIKVVKMKMATFNRSVVERSANWRKRGFHQYLWQKPSTGEVSLSWAMRLGWNALGLDDWHGFVYWRRIKKWLPMRHDQQKYWNHFLSIVVILSVTRRWSSCWTLAINMHEHRIADNNLKELAHIKRWCSKKTRRSI